MTDYGSQSVIFWVSGHPTSGSQRRGWTVGPGVQYMANSDDYPPSLTSSGLLYYATTIDHSSTPLYFSIVHKPI